MARVQDAEAGSFIGGATVIGVENEDAQFVGGEIEPPRPFLTHSADAQALADLVQALEPAVRQVEDVNLAGGGRQEHALIDQERFAQARLAKTIMPENRAAVVHDLHHGRVFGQDQEASRPALAVVSGRRIGTVLPSRPMRMAQRY